MPGLVNELVTEVEVRPVSAVSPADMAAWINRYHWNPGPLGGAPFSAGDYSTFIAERGAVETFLGMHGDRIVGSLALYPVSALKGGQGAVVWMDSFAIDPEFRLSTLPMRLFIEAFVFCVATGYDRVDCNASPANPSMVAIVRAGGFKRATAQPCGDDRLEFRSYLPLLYRYLIDSLGLGDRLVEVAQAWTNHSTSPWVPSPSAPSRTADDIEDFHGAGAFRYGVSGSGVDNSFLVDLSRDRICALDWAPVSARLYPEGGRDARVGTEVGFAHEVRNTGDRPLTVGIAVGRPGDTPLWTDEVALPPGGRVVGVTPVAVRVPGDVEVELTVRAEVLHLDRPHPATLRLHSWVRGHRAPTVTAERGEAAAVSTRRGGVVGGVRIERDDQRWVVRNRWLRLAVDGATGTASIEPRHGDGPAVTELWPDLGPPFPAALKTPPARPLTCVAAEVVDGVAVLTLRSPANIWWLRHGRAYRRQGRPGDGLADTVLQRRWTVAADQLVSVETTVVRVPPETRREIEAGDHLLRLYPWAHGRSLTLTVPLDTGTLRAPLIYERFPFGMHSLEMPDSLDLPPAAERYAEGWTAFTGDGYSAGLLWQRAERVRFGLHWMPSLLLAADGMPDGAADGPVFPPYAIFCGPGDERAVRAAWVAAMAPEATPAASTRTPLAEPAPVQLRTAPVARLRDGAVELSGQITVLSGRARHGTLTAAVADGPQVPVLEGELPGAATRPFAATLALPEAGVHSELIDVAVTWTEALVRQRNGRPVLALPQTAKPVDVTVEGDTWELNNGPLYARVAPGYGAALVSLQLDGIELLRSTYPKPRPLGIVAAGRGGISPSLAAARASATASVAQELFDWTPRAVVPVEPCVAGTAWSGVRLSGTVPVAGAPVGLDIEYLLAPGSPALLIRCRVTAGQQRWQPLQWCLAAHVDPQLPWLFRGVREQGEYEYRPSPHGSNRPVGGSRGFGSLVGERQLMLGGAGDTEIVGFRDGDDWSVRSLATLRPGRAAPLAAATCLALCDARTPLSRASALRDIAQEAAAWAA